VSTFRAPRRLLLLGLLVAATAWGSAASAATIPVTTTGDELVVNGLCSVREAIRAANLDVAQDSCPAGSAVAQDVIRIPAGTYILGLGPAGDDVGTRGDLDVLGSVSLFGVGQRRTIIDGGALDRVFEIHGGPFVAMARLTIRNGLASAGGGMQIGGSANVLLDRVTIRSNTADDGGGVLVLSSGSLSVGHSVIRDNTARGLGGEGGGILLSNLSHVSLAQATVSGNIAAGAIPSAGGGISSFGTLDVIQSKIQANTASNGGGGGIFSGGTATIRQSTVSGNVAALDGGGLSSMSPLTVVNSTFAGNTADLGRGAFQQRGRPGASQLNGLAERRNRGPGGRARELESSRHGSREELDPGQEHVGRRFSRLLRNDRLAESEPDPEHDRVHGRLADGHRRTRSAAGRAGAERRLRPDAPAVAGESRVRRRISLHEDR